MPKNGKARRVTVKKSFLENVLSWGVILLFAVLPLLYFPDRVAAYVTSKQYFLIGSVDVLVILWVWLLLNDARYRLSKKNLLYLVPLALFLVSLTVSAVFGVDSRRSFFSTVESGTGLVLLYHAFLLGCIITSLLRVQQKQLLKYILQANLFASTVLAIFTFFTNKAFRIASAMLDGSSGGAMMGNSLLVGAYFIFSVFFTLYLITHESTLWRKVLYWCGLVVILFCPIYFNVAIFKGVKVSSSYFFIGQARIATVALLIGLVLSFLIWLCTRKDNKKLRDIGRTGIVVMVLCTGLVVQKIATPTSAVHTFFVTESGNRVLDWQEALQGVRARPVLGWGLENYHVVFQQYLNPIVFAPGNGNEVWNLHPHNNTLEVLVNGGIVGLLFYICMITVLFRSIFVLYRKNTIDNVTFALLTAMLIAFIIQQQMIYDSIVSYTVFFFVIALVAGLSDTTNEPRIICTSASTKDYVLGIGIIVVMAPIWVYAAFLPSGKMVEMQHVGTSTSDKRIALYQHLFHSPGAYALNTDPEFYTDPLFNSYASQKGMLKANPLYQKIASQEVQALIDAVTPVWQTEYYNYRLSLSLLQLENLEFYLTNNQQSLTDAQVYADRAFLLSPTDPQIYTAYAETLLYQKNAAAAKQSVDKALALAPTYQPALYLQIVLK